MIFCSFGDMLRVPGSTGDLLHVRAGGGDVRIVYSPLAAVRTAQENPDREVVFFAVGFETTAPATALAAWQAKRLALHNFSMLVSHVLVPPAMQAILSSPTNRVQAFLAAGHVCTVMGYEQYLAIAERYEVPIVVTGFEPVDLLECILMTVRQLEAVGMRSRTSILARCVAGGMSQHSRSFRRSMRSATARGVASGFCPRAACD